MGLSLGILLFLYNLVYIIFMLSIFDTESRDILNIRKATYCLSLANHYLLMLDIYLQDLNKHVSAPFTPGLFDAHACALHAAKSVSSGSLVHRYPALVDVSTTANSCPSGKPTSGAGCLTLAMDTSDFTCLENVWLYLIELICIS